jgi:hypothetical protein
MAEDRWMNGEAQRALVAAPLGEGAAMSCGVAAETRGGQAAERFRGVRGTRQTQWHLITGHWADAGV